MLVDDHFVVRSGLVASLEMEDDIDVVSEVESGPEAIPAFEEHRPDVILLDLQMPGMNGIEVAEKLCESHPDARILIFSTFARDDEIAAALEAGALGYLQKSAGREELLQALRSVAAGESYLPAEIRERLSGRNLGPSITLREREILQLISKGRANKEIAAELGIAEDTVKRHVSNILQKLQVSDRAQATAEAIRRGIVRIDEGE